MHSQNSISESVLIKEKSLRRKLVYVGEHNTLISNSILSSEFDCITFRDAFQALPWLNYNSLTNNVIPDVVISDLEFPGGDAYSLFDYIKSLKSIKHIPFIAISTSISKEEKVKALSKGFDDLYAIPFNCNDLYNRIKFLQKYKKEKEKEKQESQVKVKKIPLSKRMIDITVSFLSLLLLSPLFLVIAVLIKLESKGPVFYISKRAGTGYKIINFYKFRTMHKDAEQELKNVLHLNRYPENSSFVKIKDDPRITKVGAWLRKTSLDELPQLINVLIGDMSLVGNRPLPLYEAEKLTKDQLAKRFLAPAGMTGLWQISNRGKEKLSESERIQLDITYADKNSNLEDLKILLKTLPAVLQKESV